VPLPAARSLSVVSSVGVIGINGLPPGRLPARAADCRRAGVGRSWPSSTQKTVRREATRPAGWTSVNAGGRRSPAMRPTRRTLENLSLLPARVSLVDAEGCAVWCCRESLAAGKPLSECPWRRWHLVASDAPTRRPLSLPPAYADAAKGICQRASGNATCRRLSRPLGT
jgi:hypothetical protein